MTTSLLPTLFQENLKIILHLFLAWKSKLSQLMVITLVKIVLRRPLQGKQAGPLQVKRMTLRHG